MRRPKLPKSTIECPTCEKGGGFPLKGEGFSRRRFLQVAGTGIVASYFADVISPRLLQGASTAPNVYLRGTIEGRRFHGSWRFNGYEGTVSNGTFEAIRK